MNEGVNSEVFLQPGAYFLGDARHRVRTLLGSCVSITLWHRELRVGAMTHCLLDQRPRHCGAAHPCERPDGCGRPLDSRYVEEAGILLFDKLRGLGVEPRQCEAKIFGGGEMFAHLPNPVCGLGVGNRNGQAARSFLQRHGIRIVSENLFGQGHRTILFDLGSGEVWVRRARATVPHCQQRAAA